ncbi:MAG TPA: response regulator [Kofleriaceae bacterium]|nr:response regulator [Kofleriaceae bacterium]
MLRILVVDDEVAIQGAMQRVFRKYRDRLDLQFASHAAAAVELMAHAEFDVVISDMQMPGENGLQLLQRVTAMDPSIYRVLMSGGLAPEIEAQAQTIAHAVIEKPCPSSMLLSLFARLEEVIRQIAGTVADAHLARLQRAPRFSYCV